MQYLIFRQIRKSAFRNFMMDDEKVPEQHASVIEKADKPEKI